MYYLALSENWLIPTIKVSFNKFKNKCIDSIDELDIINKENI